MVAHWPPLMICCMAATIKGQSKAAAAFKGIFGLYGPILFKLCMPVAYWSLLMIGYMEFTIIGQKRPQKVFKDNFGVLDQFC